MTHWTYLMVLSACLAAAVPLHVVFGLTVFHRPSRLISALLPGFLVFTGWDVWAIHARHWSYDPTRLVDITLPGGVPVEEVLFFLIVPLCAVLTYEAVGKTLARSTSTPARELSAAKDAGA